MANVFRKTRICVACKDFNAAGDTHG
jgi:hypothetical protein